MAATGAAPPEVLKRISLLAGLDPADQRYPRPRVYALLRWVARLWFIPISAYAGNLAMNLFAFSVRTGNLTLSSLSTHATQSDAIARLVAQIPIVGPLIVLAAMLLALFGRQVYRDARREAMVLRLREMWLVMARRQRRIEAAQALRGEVVSLEREVLDLLALVPASALQASDASGPDATGAPAAVRQRVAGLAQRSDEFARDLDTQAMIEAMAEQQMRAWEREQRAFMTVVGGATLVAGFLVPLFSTAALT